MKPGESTRLEGVHCAITVETPAPGVVLVTIEGTDVGELGDFPFRALESLLEGERRVELFVDARRARGPSVDVSDDWAQWLTRQRQRLLHVSMVTGSRFVQMSAEFVKSFTELGDVMRLYADDVLFESALSNAVANARARPTL